MGASKVTSLKSSPPATSNDRRITTIKGTWNNEGTFEYSFEMSIWISFWGEAKEPKSTEFPSTLRIEFRSPSVVTDAKNATMEQIKKASGDGALICGSSAGKNN